MSYSDEVCPPPPPISTSKDLLQYCCSEWFLALTWAVYFFRFKCMVAFFCPGLIFFLAIISSSACLLLSHYHHIHLHIHGGTKQSMHMRSCNEETASFKNCAATIFVCINFKQIKSTFYN